MLSEGEVDEINPATEESIEDGENKELVEESSPVANELEPEIVTVPDNNDTLYENEKRIKIQLIMDELLDQSKAPPSYYSNSRKESLILTYVENFKRQYTQLYPTSKPLLLDYPNQFKTRKFVCSTIRPSQLPYKELYDYKSCSKFVADYLNYVSLELPYELPKIIPSPCYTLKLQSGNCFDYSILLTSLLRGVGYDAYVVSGYATREITTVDQSKINFDLTTFNILPPPKNSTPETTTEALKSTGKYKMKPSKTLESKFLAKIELKKQTELKEKSGEVKIPKKTNEVIPEPQENDDLKGLRIHAWVLLLPGKREISEGFFIEPTTGSFYPLDSSKYVGVESVFSSANYWVNMQVCYDGLKGISFDLGDNTKWEYVLLENTQPAGHSSKLDKSLKKNNNKEAIDDEEEAANLEILDLPPSWVEQLKIPKEKFEMRCPSGSKCIEYNNVKYETFADYNRPDGMVTRLTVFEDQKLGYPGEVYEFFLNRRDKLSKRLRQPYSDIIREFFDPGRPHGLKEHIILSGKTKEMHFYPSARSDGLMKRIEEPNKILEYFTEREDYLVYRSVTHEISSNVAEDFKKGAIFKMTEKFNRNPESIAPEEVAKRTYFLKEEKIRIVFPLEKNKIIPSFREFKKPSSDQKGIVFDLLHDFNANSLAKPLKRQFLYTQLCGLIRNESLCLKSVKAAEKEVKEILAARDLEEKDIVLTVSVYDTIRNQAKIASEEKEANKGEEEEIKSTEIDYLSPFLVNYTTTDGLSKEEAQSVKEACLKSLKERLLERANIIQKRLDEATSDYQKRQISYSKNADSMTSQEADEYVKFCNNALFSIQTLEKRLIKHKESAPEKYTELDAKLRNDKRLKAAYN